MKCIFIYALISLNIKTMKPMTGSTTLTYYPLVLGKTLNVHQQFLRRLRQRLQLLQVNAMHNCGVIIAFVPAVSRAERDIEAALQKIPPSKPVVVVGLHFVQNENYTAPESNWNISRDGVFAVDLICYEDLGMVRSLRNDEALKAVTDHLISLGGTPNTEQFEATSSQGQCNPSFVIVCISLIFALGLAIAIGFSIYMRHWSHVTAQSNTTTSNTHVNNTSN